MLQPDPSPEAHQDPHLDPDPDQEIETLGSENDQHRQNNNNTVRLKENSIKTRYFLSW